MKRAYLTKTFLFLVYLNVAATIEVHESICLPAKRSLDVSTRTGELTILTVPTNTNYGTCRRRLKKDSCTSILDIQKCKAAAECNYCQQAREHKCNLIAQHQRADCPSCTVTLTKTDCNFTLHPFPGKPENVTLTFQLSQALDIYYLLDFTFSTRFNHLREQMVSYGAELSKMYPSADLRMGLGSFVDKELANSRAESSDFYNPQFFPGHIFKNWMNVSCNLQKFNALLSNVSQRLKHYGAGDTNNYFLEGQLEALTQVALCPIGWRERSKRVVVMVTDSGFHSAEQDLENTNIGKNFPPFDGKCHTDASGTYSNKTLFKYPEEQATINMLRAKNVSLLIAFYRWDQIDDPENTAWIADFQRDTSQYRAFLQKYGPSSRFWIFNSSKPLELKAEMDQLTRLEQQVRSPSSKLTEYEIGVSGNVDGLTFNYYTACGGNRRQKAKICKVSSSAREVQFIVEIRLGACPKKGKELKSIKFNLKGRPYEARLNYTAICP